MDTKSSSMRESAWSILNGPTLRVRSSEFFKQPLMDQRSLKDQPGLAPNAPAADRRLHLGQHVVVFGLLFYKAIFSPLMPLCCKFHPSCSMYAKEAIERHGVLRGLSLTLRRLLRCRPFTQGGYDPVPDA